MRRLIPLFAAAFALVLQSKSVAQVAWPPDLASKVDKVFERFDKPTSPGCALAVVRDGRVVYARGYGMANLDHDIVITPSTVFHVASVSKEFTAAAIALLAQDGKLTLDDEVRRHVAELPDFKQRITIRHLIHHTSGLRDQWDLLGLAGWRYSLDLITDEDVLELMKRQKDLNFPPGDQYMYCNTGYTLLATVVKRVSGKSFRQFTTDRIFKPLGMSRTHFRDDHAEIVKDHAYGYVPAGDTFRLSITNFDTAGATSLLTTVEDMALWDRNFYDGRVGGRTLLDVQAVRGVLNNGEKLDYALGLTHGTYRGLATVGHGGSDAGYRSDFVRFPSERTSIVCLCNLSTSNPGELTRKVADVVLEGRLAPALPTADDRPAIAVDAAQLAGYAGLFWNRSADAYRRLFVREGVLQAGFGDRGTPLKPVAPGRFATPASDLAFERGADGTLRVSETSRSGQGKPVVLEAVDQFEPTAAELAGYAGAYRSEEIEPVYRLEVENGKLTLRRLKFAAATLDPLVGDVFRMPNGTVKFVRDGSGRVTGFVFNGGRIRGFRFSKDRAGT